jgi:hypothetical protein
MDPTLVGELMLEPELEPVTSPLVLPLVADVAVAEVGEPLAALVAVPPLLVPLAVLLAVLLPSDVPVSVPPSLLPLLATASSPLQPPAAATNHSAAASVRATLLRVTTPRAAARGCASNRGDAGCGRVVRDHAIRSVILVIVIVIGFRSHVIGDPGCPQRSCQPAPAPCPPSRASGALRCAAAHPHLDASHASSAPPPPQTPP